MRARARRPRAQRGVQDSPAGLLHQCPFDSGRRSLPQEALRGGPAEDAEIWARKRHRRSKRLRTQTTCPGQPMPVLQGTPRPGTETETLHRPGRGVRTSRRAHARGAIASATIPGPGGRPPAQHRPVSSSPFAAVRASALWQWAPTHLPGARMVRPAPRTPPARERDHRALLTHQRPAQCTAHVPAPPAWARCRGPQ